jgi:hypothetical protein
MGLVLAKSNVLFLIKHHAMKTYGGSDGIDPRFLILGTGWR